jgi:hypothetical protein
MIGCVVLMVVASSGRGPTERWHKYIFDYICILFIVIIYTYIYWFF